MENVLRINCNIPVDVTGSNGESANVDIKLIGITMEQAKQAGDMSREIQGRLEGILAEEERGA